MSARSEIQGRACVAFHVGIALRDGEDAEAASAGFAYHVVAAAPGLSTRALTAVDAPTELAVHPLHREALVNTALGFLERGAEDGYAFTEHQRQLLRWLLGEGRQL